jgi:hypothetical protein
VLRVCRGWLLIHYKKIRAEKEGSLLRKLPQSIGGQLIVRGNRYSFNSMPFEYYYRQVFFSVPPIGFEIKVEACLFRIEL